MTESRPMKNRGGHSSETGCIQEMANVCVNFSSKFQHGHERKHKEGHFREEVSTCLYMLNHICQLRECSITEAWIIMLLLQFLIRISFKNCSCLPAPSSGQEDKRYTELFALLALCSVLDKGSPQPDAEQAVVFIFF